MTLTEVKNTIEFLIEEAQNSDEGMRQTISYDYIGDYYRMSAELPLGEDKKVVLNSLGQYPDVNFRIEVDEIADEHEDRPIIARDTFHYLTEWAYRNGSLGVSEDDIELPDVGEERDEIDTLVYDLNDRIEDTPDLTVNDVSLALKLTNKIADKHGYENDEPLDEAEAKTEIFKILDCIEELIDMKRDGRLDWDMMASTFDSVNGSLQEDIMEKFGERSVVRELEDYEGDSISEFLSQRNE